MIRLRCYRQDQQTLVKFETGIRRLPKMTSQKKIETGPALNVAYYVSEYGGYWVTEWFERQSEMIAYALSRGYTMTGRDAQGWPLFGPGTAWMFHGGRDIRLDTLHGPRIRTGSNGRLIVGYNDTAAAYLGGQREGIPEGYSVSDSADW
jgi:hypothetical protein